MDLRVICRLDVAEGFSLLVSFSAHRMGCAAQRAE
jgi:hypothetical protein